MNYIMFARWFGLVSLILSLGILFNLEDAKEMAKDMSKGVTGYIMGGVLPLIFGMLSLMFEDNFTSGWQTVVTSVGVIMVSVGVYRVICVKQWKSLMSRNIEKLPFLFSLFGLMFAIVLLYIGFIAPLFQFNIS